MRLNGEPSEEVSHAWEDVKAMFNGGTRKRMMSSASVNSSHASVQQHHGQQQVSSTGSPRSSGMGSSGRAHHVAGHGGFLGHQFLPDSSFCAVPDAKRIKVSSYS
jgi:hypothetical protein